MGLVKQACAAWVAALDKEKFGWRKQACEGCGTALNKQKNRSRALAKNELPVKKSHIWCEQRMKKSRCKIRKPAGLFGGKLPLTVPRQKITPYHDDGAVLFGSLHFTSPSRHFAPIPRRAQ